MNNLPNPIALMMFSGDFGGMERVVLSLAQSLQENNIPVIVYIIIESRAGIERLTRLHSFLDTLPSAIKTRVFETEKRYDKVLRREIAQALLKDQVCLVHCHCHKSAFYLARIKKNKELVNIPIVFTLHGIFLNRKKISSLAVLVGYFYAMANADVIILCAWHLGSHLQWLPWLNHKSQIIQNALPNQPFPISRITAREKLAQQFHLDKDALWVANIGRLAPEKNFELFLAISAKVKSTFAAKVQYLIIGDGPSKHSLQKLARMINVGSDVLFTGFVDDIETVNAAIDVFMMTSNTEGTSMSLLEAMRAGLPIVVTDVGGNKDIVQSGENGILFPAANILEGSEVLIKLLGNAELRNKLGKNAHTTWENHFSPTHWVAKHQAIYNSLLNL